MMTITWTKVDSPVGQLYLAATKKGLAFLDFSKSKAEFHRRISKAYPNANFVESTENLTTALEDLKRYWKSDAGRPRTKFDLAGTKFQKDVWKALMTIPSGTVISYGALAKKVGKPKASRAVGAAVGRNPISILIPCHRVIASNGTLCGYGGGLAKKAKLLSLEGALWKSR
jgi:O-6-methylguanine DNA methyltransferase